MDNQSADILIALYSQQHSNAQTILEKISKMTTGVCGIMVVIDGWLVANLGTLKDIHHYILSSAILILTGIAVYAIWTRHKEFIAVAKLIVRVETALGIYEEGRYIPKQTLFPVAYQNLGKDDYEHGNKFRNSHILVVVMLGALSIGLSIIV